MLAKPLRLRSPSHLARLRKLACCIPDCRRQPVDAHHLSHVQPKGRGLKASDSLTVPLCRWTHHSETSPLGVHHVGSEADWWRARAINPLPIAAMLWAESNPTAATEAA
jgi:hypothetical protein